MSDSPETSQRSPLYLLDPGAKRDAHINDLAQSAGEECRFPARFLVVEHEAMQQITMSYFLRIVPNREPFQRSPTYFPDPGTKHDKHDNGVWRRLLRP